MADLQPYLAYFVVAAEFVFRLCLAGFILVRSRGTPATRLAWLVIVFALPEAISQIETLFG